MVMAYYGIHKTTDELVRQTTLMAHDNGLTCAQGATLLTNNGVKASVARLTLADIRAEIDAGRPVIPLIRYGEIPGRQSTYTGGHFVVITGYSDSGFPTNDPDWYPPKRDGGAGFRVANAAIERAIQRSPAPGQCVVMR